MAVYIGKIGIFKLSNKSINLQNRTFESNEMDHNIFLVKIIPFTCVYNTNFQNNIFVFKVKVKINLFSIHGNSGSPR